MSLRPPIRDLKLCYVTDRKALPGDATDQIRLLLERIESVARAGVDWIQIREKDLPGRILAELVVGAIERVPPKCRIIVNDRLDVACAVGAAGVHLGEQSLPIAEVRWFLSTQKRGVELLVGASAHSVDAALEAEKAGADYVVFGPVFATPSKAKFGAPQGMSRLAEVCGKVSVPVMAIGGIAVSNARECLAAGAAGIAAIRLFQEAEDLGAVVRELRASFRFE